LSYEDLKKEIVITPRNIDISRKLVNEYQLSQFDIYELARLIECVDSYRGATTINKKVVDLLKKCEVILIPHGAGWRL